MIRPWRMFTTHPKVTAVIAVALLVTSGTAMAYALVVAGDGRTEIDDRRITIQQAAAAMLSEGLDLTDSDLDALPDVLENYVYGSDPSDPDTSGGGVPDGWLARHGFPPAEPGVESRPAAEPPDDELPGVYGGHWPGTWRLTLFQIYSWGRPAEWNESAQGPFDNGLDPHKWDNSGNGIPDGWLIAHGLDPVDPGVADERRADDTLTVRENYQAGTDPLRRDTDGDGLSDGAEINLHRSDPLRWSTGRHGVADGWLVRYALSPSDSSVVLGDPAGKGMTIAETFEYNRHRYGLAATLGGAGLHPTHLSSVGGPIPDAWFVRYGLDPLDAGQSESVRWRASSWPEVRHLDDAPSGAQTIPDLEWSLLDKYQYERPAGWDEPTQGPWWGGLSPMDEDTDGDGLPDIVEVRGWYVMRRTSVNPAAEAEPVRVSSDPLMTDSDGDGLTDREEYEGKAFREETEHTFSPTDPRNRDTAFSFLSDGEKVLGTRVDGIEYGKDQAEWNLDPTSASTGGANLRDGTSLRYWHERFLRYQETTAYEFPDSSYPTVDAWIANVTGGASPAAGGIPSFFRPDADLDGDSILNLMDGDSDNDELADAWELDPTLLRNSGFFPDPESVPDFPRPATDPANPDTDGDGLPDSWEVKYGLWDEQNGPTGGWTLNPARAQSYATGPSDGKRNLDGDVVTWRAFSQGPGGRYQPTPGLYDFNNLQEKDLGTNPNLADEDFDGVTEGWRNFWGRVYPGLVRQGSDAIGEVFPQDLTCSGQGAELCLEALLSNIKGQRLNDITFRTFPYVRFVEAPSPEAVQLNPAHQEVIPPGGFRANIQVLRDEGLATTSVARVEGVFPLTAVASAAAGTNPYIDDTDGDGMPDAWEVLYGCAGSDGTASPSPIRDDRGADPDGDGLTNEDEFDLFTPGIQFATDPCRADTDLGGLEDGFELALGLDPLDPEDDRTIENSQEDTDHDGIPDAEELFNGLNPFTPDTDGDGLLDSAGDRILNANDPVAAAFRDAGIAHLAVPNSNPAQQKFLGDVRADRWDTSGDGVPDGWLRYHDFRGDATAPTWAASAYQFAKPDWWDEESLGPWWWGRDPRDGDSDGDGILDTEDPDIDGDGLNDYNGEDPVPFASHLNRVTTLPTTAEEARAWGDCAGNPMPCRMANQNADYDGDGVPDRDDRAPTKLTVEAVDGTPVAGGGTMSVTKGVPFTITGFLEIDCSGAGAFECNAAPPSLPARPVFATFTSNPDQILGVAVTDETGSFSLVACVCATRTFSVPADVTVLGRVGEEVEIDSDPASIALGSDKKLRIAAYATTATFYGNHDAAADAAHPQYITMDGLLDGDAFTTHATAGTAVTLPADVELGADAVVDIDAPGAIDAGATLEGTVRLADLSGTALGSRTLSITWAGTNPPTTLTRTTSDEGVATFALPATPPAPGAFDLTVEYAGESLVAGTSTTESVNVVFPTSVTFDEAVTSRTGSSGQNVRAAGHVARGGLPVADVTLTLSVGGIPAGTLTTDPAGRFDGSMSLPSTLSAGDHELTASFPGSPFLKPSSSTRLVTLHEASGIVITAAPAEAAVGDTLIIDGLLRRPDGSGLSGFDVAAKLDGRYLNATTTDDAGGFQFQGRIPASTAVGTTMLVVLFNGTETVGGSETQTQVRVTSSTHLAVPSMIVARDTSAVVRGTLRDANDAGVAGQPIHISWGGKKVSTAVTAPNGSFAKALPEDLTSELGSFTVNAEFVPGEAGLYGPAKAATTYFVRSGSEITTDPSAGGRNRISVSGLVRTTEGEPVRDASVEIRFGGLNNTVASNATGHFQADFRDLDLPVGTIPWSAAYDGNTTLTASQAEGEAILRTTTTTRFTGPPDAGLGTTVRIEVGILEDDGRALEAPGRIRVTLGNQDPVEHTIERVPATVEVPVPAAMPVGPAEIIVEYLGDEYRDPSRGPRTVDVKDAAVLTVTPNSERSLPGRPVSFLVSLQDAGGHPIANATVGVAATTSPLPFEVTLDENGEATVTLPAPADGALDVQATYLGSDSYASTTQAAAVPVGATPTALQAAVADDSALLTVPLAVVAALSALSLVAAVVLARRRALLDHALDRVIHRLEAGDSYAAAVLLAYKRLSVYLRRFGFKERAGETPEEFLLALADVVPIDHVEARTLADLFDHARYNPDSRLGPRERLRASGAFRKLRLSIERAVSQRRRGGTPA